MQKMVSIQKDCIDKRIDPLSNKKYLKIQSDFKSKLKPFEKTLPDNVRLFFRTKDGHVHKSIRKHIIDSSIKNNGNLDLVKTLACGIQTKENQEHFQKYWGKTHMKPSASYEIIDEKTMVNLYFELKTQTNLVMLKGQKIIF